MKNLKYILVLLLVLGILYFFRVDILRLFPQFSGIEEIFPEIISKLPIEKIRKDVSSPPPLRATKEFPESFLTRSGIITLTNIQRNAHGFLPLSKNEQLNTAAFLKAQDMFEKQYFGHVSPLGVDVGGLADDAGYQFIAIGENLALGNFENNTAVVQGWMDSQGHRANILSSRYTEIGVAAVKGMFEGKSTWIAVQEFGLPLSACPEPEESLKAQIESNDIQLQELERELIVKQKELQRMRPKWGPGYNRKVKEYNALVTQYNNLLGAAEALVSEYNNQVKVFNACAAG
ncbi:MAG TPA: CAP domain-containing protein [Candidatus Nealsonbacteria bacterium]|nr:CAP domain-containing protein [Candidatus Nealsonbacteria bacterium]HEB46393.1 CAP domain-containing protein [Candidatus Nealsonbacteria bacterium]